jgi:hypothetical protein
VFTGPWFLYAVGFLAANLLLVPGLFLSAVSLGRRWGKVQSIPLRQSFIEYAYVLVPLGLAAWIAFSLSFVFINFSYVWPLLSDPFGWGWDLFGTASLSWTPYLSGVVPILQIPVLLVGLVAAINLAIKTARHQGGRPLVALPVVGFCALATAGFLWLYLG